MNSKNHIEVGLALLAVAVVLAVYMCGFHYFASRVNVAYIQSLWRPQNAVIATAAELANETERGTLRSAWRETLNHGDSLWNDMMWWAIVLVVLAVFVLLGSLGTSIWTALSYNRRTA